MCLAPVAQGNSHGIPQFKKTILKRRLVLLLKEYVIYDANSLLL